MPFTALEVLKIAFIAFLTFDFVRYLRRGQLRRHFAGFFRLSGMKWLSLLAQNAGVAAFTIVLAYTLFILGGPVMRFSWLAILATRADGPDPGGNLAAAGLELPIFGIAFMVLLMLNVPRLARTEEAMFRRGTRDWRDAMPRSIRFGLTHCLIGVPVAVGVALILPGFWFTSRYFRGGVKESTRHHAVYNWLVLLTVGVWLGLASR